MPFTMPVAGGPTGKLPPAGLDHYWHPERDGVEHPPEDFVRGLKEISPDLAVCRPPAGAPLTRERAWLVWFRKAAVKHHLCPGWSFMFDWRSPKGKALPLDPRVYANIWMMSRRQFGNAIKYFEHITEDLKRQKAAKEKTHRNDRRDHQHDMRDFYKIKNIGAGNKFALHHDSINASLGEKLWRQQTLKRRMPSEVLEDQARLVEQRADFLRGSR